MKKRILFLFTFFLSLVLAFVCQKPLFMLYNGAIQKGHGAGEFIDVMLHGLSLDMTMAGYLTVPVFVAVLISVWFKRVKLRKILSAYHLLASLFVAVVFVADLVLYPFWGFKLDASVFLYLDSPAEATASVSTGFVMLSLLTVLLLLAWLEWLLLKITPSEVEAVKHRPAATGALLLLGGLLFVVIRGGVTESTSNVGQAYFSNDQFLNHSAVNPGFSLLSSMGKSKDYASEFDFFDENRRKELFDGLYPTIDGEEVTKVLRTDRPNILIILLEGFGGVFVEPMGGMPDVAPNLNRLTEESVFFTQCFANSFRTDRGTVSALSGYLGLPTASVMKIPAKSRTLPAVSEELVKRGYRTDFVYGGDINFTNMKSYLLSKNYQELTADTDFSLSQQAGNAWGVNDDVTFDFLYDRLTSREGSEPWMTTFLTLSSHEPFEVPYSRLSDPIPNAFAYTDDCLGRFIERLKQSPVWENLLIICLPDHGFRYPRSSVDRGGEFAHIPMLWLGGAIREPMRVDRLMNQSDMAATLLGQLGMDHSMFIFSRNVLGSGYTYPFAFHSHAGGFSFRDSTGVTAFDTRANQISYEEPSPSAERLHRGQAILQSVYDDLGRR